MAQARRVPGEERMAARCARSTGMKLFSTTYVVRKDGKLLYRGKDAAQAERIASGNAQNGAAAVYTKRGSKEVLRKEYTRTDWDRTHPPADTPAFPALDGAVAAGEDNDGRVPG